MSKYLVTTFLPKHLLNKTNHFIFISHRSRSLNLNVTSNFEIAPDLWANLDKRQIARKEIEEKFGLYLDRLTDIFNEIHNVNYNRNYWQIILGTWLRTYISIVYDHYHQLRNCLSKYSGAIALNMNVDGIQFPASNAEFTEWLGRDDYNAFLYQLLTEQLNISRIVSETIHFKPNKIFKISFKASLKNNMRKLLSLFLYPFLSRAQVLLADSGLSFYLLMKLFLRSKASVVPLFSYPDVNLAVNQQPDLRKYMHELLLAHPSADPLDSCLTFSMRHFIPKAFIENRAQLLLSLPKMKPKYLFSVMGWHYNEIFKLHAATLQAEGSLLLAHQHGGDYRILDYHHAALQEINVCDLFFTWGSFSEDKTKIVSRTGMKLYETIRKIKRAPRDEIVFGSANAYHYMLRFTTSTSLWYDYFSEQISFIKELPKNLQEKTILRMYHDDRGWNHQARLKNANLNCKLQFDKSSFSQVLSNCKLYVTDHLSTTFIECIAANVPLLLYFNPIMWDLHDKVKPYFEALQHAGIIHANAKSTAQKLIEIYPEIDTWWFDLDRQKIVREFQDLFCKPASNDLSEWVQIFQHSSKDLIYANKYKC